MASDPGVATSRLWEVFGLRVASVLNLPLHRTAGEAEVTIGLGDVPAGGDLLWRTEPPLAFACFRHGTEIILDWPAIRFSITADRVVGDIRGPADAVDLHLHPVWSVVLAARGREALHACVVEDQGRALAIHGISGAGKTTAGLALIDRGWRLVTDDLLTIDDTGRAVPGPPFMRLLPDRAVGRPGWVDRAGKLRFAPATCQTPVPLVAMIVLADEHTTCRQLSGITAVSAILAQSYSPVLTHPGQAQRRFALALELAERVPIYGAPPRSLSVQEMERIAKAAMR